MAKTYLGDWGTYYNRSGNSSPDAGSGWSQDFQTRWYITYEQNTSTGITTVYVQPYLKIWHDIYPNNVGSVAITTTINGTSKTQTIKDDTDVALKQQYVYKYGTTQSFTVTPADDGTASCKFSGKTTNDMTGSTITRTASHTWSLPTISVASTITNNTSKTSRIDFGKPVTFTIDRPNTSITHTLTYEIAGTTYTIGTGLTDTATYTFKTDFINNYPNVTDDTGVNLTITCLSSNGKTSTTTVYLKIPDSYKPTLVLDVTDGNEITRNWGIWIQNKSILNFVLTPTLSASSPIKTYYTSINGTVYYDQSRTISPLSLVGEVNITSNVTDNRNRVSANQTKTLNVYDYSNPTISKAEVIRCNENGEEDNDGIYGKIVCSYSITSCENNNAKTLTVSNGNITIDVPLEEYSGENVTTSSIYDFSDLDVTANHTFIFKISDSFTTYEQSYTMPPSFVLVSKRAGGNGITFGQIATKDGLHSYLDSFFHKSLMVNSIKTKNLINIENPTPYNAGSLEISKETINFKSTGTYAQLQYNLYDLEPNTEYTLSYDFTATDMTSYETNMEINGNGSWQNQIGNVIGYGTKQTTFNSGNYDYITLVFPICGSTFIENTGFLSNLQLEKGSEVSEYSEFLGVGFTSGKNEKGSWIKFDDGTLVCRGIFEIPANTEKQEIYFPTNFINSDYQVFMTNKYNYSRDVIFSTGSLKTNYFNVFPTINGAKPTVITNAQYVAIGYWK